MGCKYCVRVLETFYCRYRFISICNIKIINVACSCNATKSANSHAFSIEDLKISANLFVIPIKRLLKHSRQSTHTTVLYLEKFNDYSICIVKMLRCYITKTKAYRCDQKQLFISFVQPYTAV